MKDMNMILFSEDPKRLSTFYEKVLQSETAWEGGEFVGLKAGKRIFTIGPHSKVQGKNNNPERMMFNFETEDVKSEFKRIKEIGAKVIAEPYVPDEDSEMTIATFADPDGNYFQLMTPMEA